MKIDLYWDLRFTYPHRHTGVGKHVIEVTSGLLHRRDSELRVLLARDQASLWSEQAEAYGWESIPTVVLPFTNKQGRLLMAFTPWSGFSHICSGRDILYTPMELLLAARGVPCVNTIHGIPFLEPSLPPAYRHSALCRREGRKQKWFVQRSRRLCTLSFAVSSYLIDRLNEEFAWPRDRLFQVNNGAAELFFAAGETFVGEQCDPEVPVFLVVGGVNAFDGAPHVVSAAEILGEAMPEARIWVVGDRHEEPWESELRSMRNVEWLGFLSSNVLCQKMQQATALLYFPLVESFGIIGVEAMAVGLPILASRSTAVPEVLGNAALWLEPESRDGLKSALQRIAEDPSLRQELRRKGRQQAAQYRWSRVVERVATGLQWAIDQAMESVGRKVEQ